MPPNVAIAGYCYLLLCHLSFQLSITQPITVKLWGGLVIQQLCFVEWVFGWWSSGHGHRCIQPDNIGFWKGTNWCWIHAYKGAYLNRCFCLMTHVFSCIFGCLLSYSILNFNRSACLVDMECRKSTSLLILKLLGTSVYCLGAKLFLHHLAGSCLFSSL